MMDQILKAFTLFTSLLVEAFPFLLLGVILSSGLLLFIDERQLLSRFPKNPLLGSFVGSCIGFLFPVCECGNVPVARRFLMQGVPSPVAIGFLLAAPTINPIVIWSTWVAFPDQPEIVFFRIVFSLLIAVFIGCIFGVQKDVESMLQPLLAKRLGIIKEYGNKPKTVANVLTKKAPALLQSGSFILGESNLPQSLEQATKGNFRRKFGLFLENSIQELRELGGMLIIGSAIAASIQVFVPREIILSLGQGTITSILAMMLLAAVVSICSTVDAFFVLSFSSTFTTSSLLAFLVFGPMIDIKAMGLMLSIFKPRILIYLFGLAAQLVFILALCHNYFF
jgi:uncharacterized protein